MTTLEVVTIITARPERCFDLARSQAAHVASAEATGERIVSGPPQDLLGLGDEVTFEARHLGVRMRLSARITEMEVPLRFVDEATAGPFRSLRHEHLFEPTAEGTRMIDRLTLAAPFGVLGLIAERLFLRHHLRRFLENRGKFLQSVATKEEAEGITAAAAG